MLKVQVDHTALVEGATYDVASVRVCMTDQDGNTLPYFFGTVAAQISGDIESVSEEPLMLRGGMGGMYVRTKGKEGAGTLTLSAPGCESVSIDFTVTG